jgi:hypothetical protein
VTRTPGDPRPAPAQSAVLTPENGDSNPPRVLKNDAWGLRVLDILEQIEAGLGRPKVPAVDDSHDIAHTKLAS